jgi:hypothetical protein
MKRNSQSDDNGNDITKVSRLCALAGQLTGAAGDPAGITTASDGSTISAPGLPWSGATAGLLLSSAATGLPRSGATAGLLLSSTAAGLPRSGSRLRRTNFCAPAAASRSGPTAPPRSRDGVDTGLLELGRPLGVGTGSLCGPSLPSCRLGRWPLAPEGRDLGLESGALAPVVSAQAQ